MEGEAMSVFNPRFPHRCKLYRMEGETPFAPGREKVLYTGECRKYGNSSVRSFFTNNVAKADYAISVPGTLYGVRAGDLCDVEDASGATFGNLITDVYAGNLGTTIYINKAQT